MNTPYQSSGDEEQSWKEDDEERHFSVLMESLGASNIFEELVLMFYHCAWHCNKALDKQ